MMQIIVQYDERKEIYDNVTKVDGFLTLDAFENYITIFQGTKKTNIKQYEINSFEIKEEGGVNE